MLRQLFVKDLEVFWEYKKADKFRKNIYSKVKLRSLFFFCHIWLIKDSLE